MLTYLPPHYVNGVAISLGSDTYKWDSGYFSGDVSAVTGTFTGNVTTITPTATGHAATKGYVDGLGAYLIDGSVALTAALNANNQDIGTSGTPAGAGYFSGNVTTITPTLTNHAATKGYVDSAVSGVGAYLIDGSIALTAALNIDGQDIGTVGDPAGDAYATTAHFAESTAPSSPASGVTVFATADGLRAIGDDGMTTELTTVVEEV